MKVKTKKTRMNWKKEFHTTMTIVRNLEDRIQTQVELLQAKDKEITSLKFQLGSRNTNELGRMMQAMAELGMAGAKIISPQTF